MTTAVTILIVSDNEESCTYLAKNPSAKDWQTDEAWVGSKAVELARRKTLMMPWCSTIGRRDWGRPAERTPAHPREAQAFRPRGVHDGHDEDRHGVPGGSSGGRTRACQAG